MEKNDIAHTSLYGEFFFEDVDDCDYFLNEIVWNDDIDSIICCCKG